NPNRFPTAWRDPRPRKKDESAAPQPGAPHDPPASDGKGRGAGEGRRGNSTVTVSSVRGLVHNRRAGQPGIRRVVFTYDKKTSMRWEEFVVDLRTVQQSVDGVRVFHAQIAAVQIWGSKSVSLVLDVPNHGAEAVCHVPFGPT